MNVLNRFDEMFEKANNGQITESEWNKYCFECLGLILDSNKDVLLNLKDNWE